MERLLVEKYRPKTVDEYIFQDEAMEKKVRAWVEKGQIPNLMFSGIQGCGKTTLSRVLINDLGIQDSDVLTINGSMLKIDYIREVLEPWLKRASFSKFKIVQLEELDRPLQPVQQALRTVIEDYSDTTRWITTCNYANKVIPPLISRFQHIEMGAVNEAGILGLILDIMEKENIGVLDENDLLSHVNAYAPDIRKIINSIDQHTGPDGLLDPLTSAAMSEDIEKWETIWEQPKPEEKLAELLDLTQFVDQNNFEWFFEVMYENSKNMPDEAGGVILLSQYLDRATRVANQRLNLDALLYHMFVLGE